MKRAMFAGDVQLKRTHRSVLALVTGLLMVASPVFGHHGTSVSYDHENPIMLKGTVTEWVWANPHSRLFFDVTGEDGIAVNWGGETLSPGVFRRRGYSRRIFAPGDEVTLSIFPSRAGTSVGELDLSKPVWVNGEELVPTGRN